MADEETTATVESKNDEDGLGDAGKRAIQAERDKARKAESDAKAARDELAKLKEDSDSSKSDMDKIKEQLSKLTERAEKAEGKALKAEVAEAKGLSAKQAARLSGKTREELESDADDLIETFGVSSEKKSTDSGKEDGGESGKDGDGTDKGAGKTRQSPTELRDGTIPSSGNEKSGEELADEVWKRTRGDL